MTGDTELGLLFRDPFPEPEPTTEPVAATPRPRRIRQGFKRRRTVTAVVVIVVLIAGGFGVWAATGSSAATYRWATVTKADVDQTLDSYGTVTPIHQANVTFPVSGTVATVPVKIGQQVKAGQTLATLDISDLQSKLDSAKSTLATAQAKLVSDENAQATGTTVSATNTSATLGGADTGQATPLVTQSPSGGTGRTGGSGGTGGTGGTGGSGGAGGLGGTSGTSAAASSAEAAVTQAQNQLLSDQHKLDQLTSVEATVPSVCGPVIAALQTTPHVTPAPSASPAGSGGAGGVGPATVPDATACTNLLATITSDQPLIMAAQSAISSDEAALTAAITKLAAAKSGSSSSSGGSTGGNSSGGSTGRSSSGSSSSSSFSGSGRTGSGGGGGGGGTTVTADQLVVDQATVDADTLNAYVDAEALNQASLVSPLAGTVAAINVSPGSTASTSTASVTVIGPGVDQVSTTVTDLDLKDVHVGSAAIVTPDGGTTTVHGTITNIGLLPVSTTSSSSSSTSGRGAAASSASSSSSSSSSASATTSSATYPVTISLDTGGLYSGSGADVSIVVKQLSGVVAVPTSAVTTLGALHTVTLQSGGKAVRRVVVVGATDATFTQITSGLTTGEHVALAQVNLPVPSSGSTTNLARLAGGGGTGRAAFTRTGAGGGGTGRTGTTGATRTGG